MIGSDESKLKLIIAGGRDYDLTDVDLWYLDTFRERIDGLEIVTGGCPTGADFWAEVWARTWGIPVKTFKAHWDVHGRAAGPIRNEAMAAYGDAVMLFPGGRGTESMKKEAVKKSLFIFDDISRIWIKNGVWGDLFL